MVLPHVCESLLNNCQSSDICLRNISHVADNCFESIIIELQISKHEKINVGCMYRAPNTSLSKFNYNLSFTLGNLTSKIAYICGDYNIDQLHCEERAETKHFLDQMSGLYPLITRPTRITGTSATIIDNIFCSELCRNKACGIILKEQATQQLKTLLDSLRQFKRVYSRFLCFHVNFKNLLQLKTNFET